MHYKYFTEKLLNLQGVIVTDVILKEETNEIHLDLVKKECTCPRCNSKTSKVHDYRLQKVKDVPTFSKDTILIIRKRRYVCESCSKRFYEKLDFLPRYYRITIRVIASILEELSQLVSYKQVSKRLNLSVTTIVRIFDKISYPKIKATPKVIAIDEFKGNAGNEKYLAIITDVENKKVLDILPNRTYEHLVTYFNKIDKSKTEFFVSDMWKPYRGLKNTHFKNSKLITDKYHFVRQVIWDFEKVRKDEQKKLSKTYRVTFKLSKSLLNKRFDTLKDYEKQKVKNIFRISSKIEEVHGLKENFLDILTEDDFYNQKLLLNDWLSTAYAYDIKEFKTSTTAITNWHDSINNAFESGYSNGFTEGCNNKIKVLKRVSYGVRNFNRFRNRILHIFNY